MNTPAGTDPTHQVGVQNDLITPLTLTLNGQPISAHPGQSVGAALTDSGVRSWRSTRQEGRPRGLFCGIGICYDCLITVDGIPNQRACMVAATDGMALSTNDADQDHQRRTQEADR